MTNGSGIIWLEVRRRAVLLVLAATLVQAGCRPQWKERPAPQSPAAAARSAEAGANGAMAAAPTTAAEAASVPAATPSAATPPATPPAAAKPAGPVPATAPKTTEFLPLVGRWVRTDTPYVIDIQRVGRDGTLEAGYYNPRPIHVARAMAKSESGEMGVFIELRDVNYPGSTYTLVYNRAQDLLQGVYYQAALRESYEVQFARLPAQIPDEP